MPLPSGFPAEYALCAGWLTLGLALLAAFNQLGPNESLRDAVRRRTFSRLLSLNEWLNAQIERQWKQLPSPDVIPDLDTLTNLKRRVDHAHAVQERLETCHTIVELGRGSAAIHIVAALATAVTLVANADRASVRIVAEPVFLILVALSVGFLLTAAVDGVVVARGSDL